MKGEKILVIVIIIVAVLAVAGTVFGYLFLKNERDRIFWLVKKGLEETGLLKDHAGDLEEKNHA